MSSPANPFAIFGGKYGSEPSGPFAEYLSGQKPPPDLQQAQLQPSGREGKLGQAAFFLDQFLRGAQQGTQKRQQMELAKEQTSENVLNDYLRVLQDKDPVQAQKLANEIITARGQKAMQFLEGATKSKGKDGQKSPHSHILEAMKNIGTGLMGGKVEKFQGYGDKMGDWAQRVMGMPSKAEAQQRDVSTFNNLVQQESQKIKEKEGREPYLDELMQNPQIRNSAESVKSLYGVDPTAGFKEAYAADPYRGLPEDERATRKAQAKTDRIQAELIGNIMQKVQVGSTGISDETTGFSQQDVIASLYQKALGVKPGKSTPITVEDVNKHKFKTALEKTDPNTNTTKIVDLDGNELGEDWVKTTRVDSARQMQLKPAVVGGKRVYTAIDTSDPEAIKVYVPKDASGNPIQVPEATNRSAVDRSVAQATTAYKQYQDRILSAQKAKSQAQNQVRNSLDYISAKDDNARNAMLEAASRPYDAILKDLKPQLKSQLALISALSGTDRVINAALHAGVIDDNDAASVNQAASDQDQDIDVTRIAPPGGPAPIPTTTDVNKLRRNAPPR